MRSALLLAVRRTFVFSLLGALPAFQAPAKGGSPALPLHNLAAGSRLIARVPILIPANQADIALAPRQAVRCVIRMRERMPFDRLISPGHPLTVTATSRAGFAAPRRHEIDTTTYVHIDSNAVQDFACANPQGEIEASIPEFERSVSALFKLEGPTRPPVEIN